eukprot:CFRG5803T1
MGTFIDNSKATPNEQGTYSYTVKHEIAEKYGINVLPDGQIATVNNRGFQMSTPSTLVDEWIKAYDGKLPLLDIGSAYGINTFKAAMAKADVVAIDMAENQLAYIKEAWEATPHDPDCGKVKVMHGRLPELDIKDKNLKASAILCAEVLHFLEGKELAPAFKRMYELLKPGGMLTLTTCGIDTLNIEGFDDIKQIFLDRKANNVAWPGEVGFDGQHRLSTDQVPNSCRPTLIHILEPEQLRRVAEENGFTVELCQYAHHPGLPKFARDADEGRIHIQLLARRNN